MSYYPPGGSKNRPAYDVSGEPTKRRRWRRWLLGGAMVVLLLALAVPAIIAWILFQGITNVDAHLPEGQSSDAVREEIQGSEVLGSGATGLPSIPTPDPNATVEEVRQQIVDRAQKHIPSAPDSDEEILVATQEVCANLDAGWGPVELATRADLPVDGWEDRAKFLGLAVGMECPEYTDEAIGWYEQFQKVRDLQGSS